jgi:IS30 family transposase
MNNVSPLSLTNEEMPYTHITPSNQNELSALLRTKTKQKEIALLLEKDRTSIWRERKRNEDENGKYNARKAKDKTTERQVDARRFTSCNQSDKKIKKVVCRKRKNLFFRRYFEYFYGGVSWELILLLKSALLMVLWGVFLVKV